MEALLQGVNEAQAILKAVEAETELFNDVSLVAQLVAKLQASGQERWHQDQTNPEFLKSQKKVGVKFLAWLERQGEAANLARLTQQALSLARQATAQNAVQRCASGGKAGHKAENCTRREGRGKHLDQGLAGSAFAASGTSQHNQRSGGSSRRSRTPLGGEPGQQGGSRSPDHIPRQEWAQKLLTEEGSKRFT